MNVNVQLQSLDATTITHKIASLSIRVEERFPQSDLLAISQKLLEVSQRATDQIAWIAQPIIWLRLLIALTIVLIGLAMAALLYTAGEPIKNLNVIEVIQTIESGINDVVFIAVGLFFLVSLERRFKRHRAIEVIYELRAIAHLIDMYQLSKDPDRLHWESLGVVAPRHKITAFQLTRYLDYCSEMLSLVGKLAVLYIHKFDDSVASAAVNEVETLTTGLSRKIWQKLMIIHQHHEACG